MAIDGGLHSLLIAHLPRTWHAQRIETGAVGTGVPDCNWCADGVEFWTEYKSTATTKVDFQPEQPGWIARRTRAGGRVWILVRRTHRGGPRRGPPVDELWVIPGRHVEVLAQDGLSSDLAALTLGGGPRRWEWEKVSETLTTTPPPL